MRGVQALRDAILANTEFINATNDAMMLQQDAASTEMADLRRNFEEVQVRLLAVEEALKTKASTAELKALEGTVAKSLDAAAAVEDIKKELACLQAGGEMTKDAKCMRDKTVRKSFTCVGPNFQSWKVPKGVSKVSVKAWGGGGAGSQWCSGGAGGYIAGDFIVKEAEVFQVGVACSQKNVCIGQCGARRFNGGWPGATQPVFAANGGGGYSGVFRTNDKVQVSQTNAVAVAGGGGGGGAGAPNQGEERGGAGGGDIGQGGTAASECGCDNGRGGTQSAGGAAGDATGVGDTSTTPSGGEALLGGAGHDGGGGGAGWYGGGGGTRGGTWLHGGGGGGSSGYNKDESIGIIASTWVTKMGNLHELPGGVTAPEDGYVHPAGEGGYGTVGGPGLVVLDWNEKTELKLP